jgi:polysaccharide deacetylase family protein (PEP-CTERM system associated)
VVRARPRLLGSPSSASSPGAPPTCLLTFDVEDWFQVENLRRVFPPERWDTVPRRVTESTRVVLDLLDAYGLPATFFVLGWVAEREPALVREIAARGHEVACHGYGHMRPTRLSRAQFLADVARTRRVLEALSGQPVVGYRAPSFSMTREHLATLADSGFTYDSSVNPVAFHDRYQWPRDLGEPVRPGVFHLGGGLMELALPVVRYGPLPVPISGGGYFRLYPGAVFRALVRRAIARDRHYVLYLHSWEFDPAQPRVDGAGRVRTLRHYNALDRVLPRMRRLLEMLGSAGARPLRARELVAEVAGALTDGGARAMTCSR